MATKSMAYDHPAYLIRQGESAGEAGGAATTAYGKFAAFTAMLLFAAQVSVTVAGTTTGAASGLAVVRLSGTNTTTLATVTLSTQAVGYTTNVALTTATGGLSIVQGDVIYALSLTDATVKAALSFEMALTPGANITV